MNDLDPILPYEMLSHSFDYGGVKYDMLIYVMPLYSAAVGGKLSHQVILENVVGEDGSPVDSIPEDYIESLRVDIENEINATYHKYVNNIHKEITDFFRDVGCARVEYLSLMKANKTDCCSGNSCGCHHGAD